MKFKDINSAIMKCIEGEYEICQTDIKEFLLYEKIQIIRIRRKKASNARMKTLVLADISDCYGEIKKQLKDILNAVADIKDSVPNTENIDVYLFLALPDSVDREECIRIESTEQLCRKYVLMPDESVSDLLARSILSPIVENRESVDGREPVMRAFANVRESNEWLSDELQDKWKKAFESYTGIELAEMLIDEGIV